MMFLVSGEFNLRFNGYYYYLVFYIVYCFCIFWSL